MSIFDKIRIPVAAALATLLMVTGAAAWENSESEEDWGATCWLSASYSGGTVKLMSGKGKASIAMLISMQSYPQDTASVSLYAEMDNGSRFANNGAMNDYFGEISFDLNRSHLEKMMGASSMTLTIARSNRITVGLDADSQLTNFLACAGNP